MIVAFSVQGSESTFGVANLIKYDTILANVGGGWDGASVFTAPRNGVYYFSVHFMKDAYYEHGTEDDVFVTIQKRTGVDTHADVAIAQAGEGGGKRGTGSASVVLELAKGDEVRTVSTSEAGETRNIPRIFFSGFLIN